MTCKANQRNHGDAKLDSRLLVTQIAPRQQWALPPLRGQALIRANGNAAESSAYMKSADRVR